jgi:hypothetical protein
LCAAKRRGLRRYRVVRAPEDPNRVMVELEFGRFSQADTVRAALANLSQAGYVFPACRGTPEAKIISDDR